MLKRTSVDARKHIDFPRNGGGGCFYVTAVLGCTSDCHRLVVSLLGDLNPPRVTPSTPPWLLHRDPSSGADRCPSAGLMVSVLSHRSEDPSWCSEAELRKSTSVDKHQARLSISNHFWMGEQGLHWGHDCGCPRAGLFYPAGVIGCAARGPLPGLA